MKARHRGLVAFAALWIVLGSLASFFGYNGLSPSFRRFGAPVQSAAPVDTGNE